MVYSSSQAHRRPRSIKQKKGYCITDLSVVYSLAAAVALKLLLATAADAEADAIDPTLEEKTIHQNSSLARADLDRYWKNLEATLVSEQRIREEAKMTPLLQVRCL